MEIYAGLGIPEEIYRRGAPQENPVATGLLRRGAGQEPQRGPPDRQVGAAGGGDRDPEYVNASPCPTTNLPQIRLEPVLKAHAEKLNAGGIRLGDELIALEQDDTGVLSMIRTRATGGEYQIRSQYVIAADGGRTVGNQVGIRVDGQRQSSLSHSGPQ
jgi:2,4-dichlorophenol 6-monooxygenase